MANEAKMSLQDRLQARADKLKADLDKANARIQQIINKNNKEDRKKRTAKLCDTASILYIINPELIETKTNSELYRQILGMAISLNNLRNDSSEQNKEKLDELEVLAKNYLNTKDKTS